MGGGAPLEAGRSAPEGGEGAGPPGGSSEAGRRADRGGVAGAARWREAAQVAGLGPPGCLASGPRAASLQGRLPQPGRRKDAGGRRAPRPSLLGVRGSPQAGPQGVGRCGRNCSELGRAMPARLEEGLGSRCRGLGAGLSRRHRPLLGVGPQLLWELSCRGRAGVGGLGGLGWLPAGMLGGAACRGSRGAGGAGPSLCARLEPTGLSAPRFLRRLRRAPSSQRPPPAAARSLSCEAGQRDWEGASPAQGGSPLLSCGRWSSKDGSFLRNKHSLPRRSPFPRFIKLQLVCLRSPLIGHCPPSTWSL